MEKPNIVDVEEILQKIKELDALQQDIALNELKKKTGLNKTALLKRLEEIKTKKDEPKPKKNVEKEEAVSFFEDGDKIYEEIITENGITAFIDSDLNIVNNAKYKTINDEILEKGCIILPTGVEEYESDEELIEEIKTHIKKYYDMNDEFLEYATYYIFLTWIYDRLGTVPYLRVLGDWGTGKSRFISAIGMLCYKPMKITGAATPAPIYRIIEKWKGTLLVEEADRKQSDASDEVTKILNCGYERNNPVIRCDKDTPDDIQTFDVFGPKVISTRLPFYDKALESRCITYKTEETDREDIPPLLPPSFYVNAEKLRNKLLLWRLRNWKKIDPNLLEEPAKFGLVGLEPRLKQTMTPFMVLFTNEALRKRFIEFMKKVQIELIEDRSESLEGQIVLAIKELIEDDRIDITPTDITNIINEDIRSEKNKLSNRTTGKHLRGLKVGVKLERRGEKTPRIIKIPQKLWRKLLMRYDPETWNDYVSNVSNVSNVSSVTGTGGGSWGPTSLSCPFFGVQTNVTHETNETDETQKTLNETIVEEEIDASEHESNEESGGENNGKKS